MQKDKDTYSGVCLLTASAMGDAWTILDYYVLFHAEIKLYLQKFFYKKSNLFRSKRFS